MIEVFKLLTASVVQNSVDSPDLENTRRLFIYIRYKTIVCFLLFGDVEKLCLRQKSIRAAKSQGIHVEHETTTEVKFHQKNSYYYHMIQASSRNKCILLW
jgi:hypothetical protein